MKPRKLKFLGRGNSRKTYLLPSGKRVIKFPYGNWGEGDNSFEGTHQHDRGCPTAKCRLIKYLGKLCLVMELVQPVKSKNDLPEWCQCIDCCQVGYNRNNKLVAYDFA